jgi:hypothetical protein
MWTRRGIVKAAIAAMVAPALLIEAGAVRAEDHSPAPSAGEKKKRKSDAELTYERRLPENWAPFGPYTIRAIRDGQTFEGRVTVAVEAKDVPARQMLWGNKQLVNGILFPLAVKLFEGGRPTPSSVESFKKEAQAALDARFKGQIKGVYVKDVMGG